MVSYKEKRTFPYRLEDFPYHPATMLAPMEGVTNSVIREKIGKLGGIGILCTEFLRVTNNTLSRKVLRKNIIKYADIPLSVQIMGKDEALMGDSAEQVALAGADIVDINLGCPTSRAARGGVGASMLKDPDLLYRILSEMRAKVPGMLSAKIRAGFDESDHILDIAGALDAAGIDFLVVHPRRRKDQYEGHSDWEIIKILKENMQIPVVGNGDVVYADDALRMEKQTGCDAVMIGRGAMRNPWIFRQIDDLKSSREMFLPNGQDVLNYVEDVACGYEEFFAKSPQQLLPRMKELTKFLSGAFPDTDWRQALRQQEIGGLMNYLTEYLQNRSSEDLDYGLRSDK